MDKETINNIFKELLDKYTVKCGTIKEMQSQLKGMSQEEKNNSLDGLLNDAEKEHYNHLIDAIQELDKVIDEHEGYLTDGEHEGQENFLNYLLDEFKNDRETLTEKAFQYERRIIEGYNHKTGSVPNVNVDDYAQDNTIPYDEWKGSMDVKLGDIEKRLIDIQIINTRFTKDNLNSLKDYFHEGFSLVNSRLNNGQTWNRLNNKEKEEANSRLNKMERDISDAIDKTEGVPFKMKVFHGGAFDVTKTKGDKIKFKGYLSTSLQKNVADSWMGDKFTEDGTPCYTYQILINEKTKGVLANDNHEKVLTHHRDEHELLLDKGFEGTIYDVDVENHIVTLV